MSVLSHTHASFFASLHSSLHSSLPQNISVAINIVINIKINNNINYQPPSNININDNNNNITMYHTSHLFTGPPFSAFGTSTTTGMAFRTSPASCARLKENIIKKGMGRRRTKHVRTCRATLKPLPASPSPLHALTLACVRSLRWWHRRRSEGCNANTSRAGQSHAKLMKRGCVN